MKSLAKAVVVISLLSSLADAQTETLAVLPFQGGGEADSTVASAVTGFVQNAIVGHDVYRVRERAQIDKVVGEQGFELSGVTDHELEVGKLLAVNKLVTGQITKLGKRFTLVINLVNVQTGELIKSQKRSAQIALEDIDEDLVAPTVELLLSVKQRTGFTLIVAKVIGLPKMDALSATDAWVQVTVGNRLIGRTRVIQDNNAPEFDERFEISDFSGEPIILTVYDQDVNGAELIGNVTIPEPKNGKYPIVGTVNGQNIYRGQIEVEFER